MKVHEDIYQGWPNCGSRAECCLWAFRKIIWTMVYCFIWLSQQTGALQEASTTRSLYVCSLFVISVANCRNIVKWYCGC